MNNSTISFILFGLLCMLGFMLALWFGYKTCNPIIKHFTQLAHHPKLVEIIATSAAGLSVPFGIMAGLIGFGYFGAAVASQLVGITPFGLLLIPLGLSLGFGLGFYLCLVTGVLLGCLLRLTLDSTIKLIRKQVNK